MEHSEQQSIPKDLGKESSPVDKQLRSVHGQIDQLEDLVHKVKTMTSTIRLEEGDKIPEREDEMPAMSVLEEEISQIHNRIRYINTVLARIISELRI